MVAAGEILQPIALGIAYHEAGAYDAELASTQRARRRFPAPILQQLQLRAFAGLRKSDDAISLADSVLRGITDSLGRAVPFVITGALELRAHGDSVAANRLLGMARTWYATHRLAQPPSVRVFDEGRAFYLTGQLDSAEARFRRAARDTTNLDAAGYIALIRVRRGDRERAAAMADSLGRLGRKWLFGSHTLWHAAIVGALGDKEGAVRLLRQASSEGASMESWHYAPELDPLRGNRSFEELIRPAR